MTVGNNYAIFVGIKIEYIKKDKNQERKASGGNKDLFSHYNVVACWQQLHCTGVLEDSRQLGVI